MKPFPQDRSILILDNCAIHKTRALREIVEGFGCILLFLLLYSPDFNPIEESFSCGTSHVCTHNSCSAGELTKSLQSNSGYERTGIRFKPLSTWRLCCSSPQQQLQQRKQEAGSLIQNIILCRTVLFMLLCTHHVVPVAPPYFIPIVCLQNGLV